jgi:hypothetical protein
MKRYLSLALVAALATGLCACQTVPAALTDVSNVLSTVASAASGVASVTTGAVSSVASSVSTDATAAADATPTVASLVSDVESIIADGKLSGTAQTNVAADLKQLQTIAGTVTPASTGTALSSAIGGIGGVLTDIGQYLPDVLPLLSLVENEPVRGDVVFLAVVTDAPAVKVVHSDPAKIASLQKHLKALKAIAAAKVNAGK